jgi:hypothetical protein
MYILILHDQFYEFLYMVQNVIKYEKQHKENTIVILYK